ncbi:MAG: putative bifunctional diguanylate cyclase/phosphodiesterase, partial [Micromonosporaceae bacterium]
PLLAVAAFVAGWLGLGAELVTATIVATVCCGWYGLRLCRLALHPNLGAAHRGAGLDGPSRSIGLLGLGLLVCGVTCAGVAGTRLVGAAPATASVVVAGGLGAAMAVFLPALVLMPGAATDPIAQLRRGLDGVSVGLCLLFTAWVLAIAPNGHIISLGFWVALLAGCTVSVAAVTALRTGPRWPGARTRSTAVTLAGTGLAGLAIGLANTTTRSPTGWPTVSAALIGAAAALAWLGAWRGITGPPEPAGGAETFAGGAETLAGGAETLASGAETLASGAETLAGFPVLALPAAVAVAVAVVRLVTDGAFDKPSVLLGLAGVGAVAARETLAARDVSRYARRLAVREAHFRALAAGSTDVAIVVDRDLIVRWLSPAAARQFGLSEQEVLGRMFLALLHPDDAPVVRERFAELLAARWQRRPVARPALVAARLRDGFGRWRETESTLTDQLDVPEVGAIVVHVRDVGERGERARPRASLVDPLTGLANRRQLLLAIVAVRAGSGGRGALVQLELDGLSSVNNMCGVPVADAVLVEVARRLRVGVAATDLLARLGGDQFAVVTEAGPVQAYALACRLVELLAEPVALPGPTQPTTVDLRATAGLTDLGGGKDLDDVLRRADLAGQRARQLGRGRVEWYDETIESHLLRRMTLERELPGVLERGELDLVYQPVVDLTQNRPLGVEALLRWRHPRLGPLGPAEIMPVADDIGAGDDIGAWVLNESCRQLSRWLREGRDLWLTVNLPTQQVAGFELVGEVTATLKRWDVPPERLVIEVAEGGLGARTGVIADQLASLRAIGLRTALGDFGAGAESLANLRGLPLDLVRLGQPFFGRPAQPTKPADPIIEVVVGLGRRLGVDVIAEGLECPAHLDVVRGAGCRFGQGPLFACPQPAERIEAYLDTHRGGYPKLPGCP